MYLLLWTEDAAPSARGTDLTRVDAYSVAYRTVQYTTESHQSTSLSLFLILLRSLWPI